MRSLRVTSVSVQRLITPTDFLPIESQSADSLVTLTAKARSWTGFSPLWYRVATSLNERACSSVDRALASGARGHRFKSCQARHETVRRKG